MFDHGVLKNTYEASYPFSFPEIPNNTVIGALSGFAFGNINIEKIEFLGKFSVPNDPHFENSFGSFFNCLHIKNVKLPTTAPIYNYLEAGVASTVPDANNFIGQKAFQACGGIEYFEIPS
jgi:hypothetical protein